VPRIFISWQWLENPRFITHGGWPPLHFYLMAASLWLWFDPVRSPAVLHILLSTATAIPLWAFVRREWGEEGALFVAAAYLFYPLAWHLGFMPASEIPFVFFVALAMYFLSRARETSEARDAILAGVSMTLGAAVRFEAWALIPLFAVLLWRRWKILFLYLLCASVFPVFWMTGNVLHGLDPISHMSTLREWELNVEAINQGLNANEVLRRIIYFPAVVFFSLTPPVAVICSVGAWLAWKDCAKRIWLLPLAALLFMFMVQVVRGLGATTARFSLVLGMLFLPFSAAAIVKFKNKRWAPSLAAICIFLMIPLSYSRVVLYRLAGPDFPNPFPADIQAVPKIGNETKEIARIVRQNLRENSDGLLVDFFGKDFYPWKDTFYVGLMSHHHPGKIFFMPGGLNQRLNETALKHFLHNHPSGVLVRTRESKWIDLQQPAGAPVARIAGTGLLLDPVSSVKSMSIYRYRVSEVPAAEMAPVD
jgi:hypothetical protein